MPDGENSTMAGDFGSTVSRNWFSATSSMRPPFSEMLPETRGVSILMRGAAAMAASRLTMVAAAGCWLAGAAPGAGGLVVAGGELAGAAPGCGVGLANWLWICCCARCRSICGML